MQAVEGDIAAAAAAAPARPHRRLPALRQAALLTILTWALFVGSTRWVAQGFTVEGECMEPRLATGERLLGEKLTFHIRAPRRGDVIIFRHPLQPAKLYIKRIIAVGGEMVEIRRGQVYVNGRALTEPYRTTFAPGGDLPPHRVMDGGYFVLGDNRDVSDDSRHWGDVDRSAVVAHAWVRYWPVARLARLK
jgi:signal peptidase I